MTLANLPKKYDVHPNMVNTWKRSATSIMSQVFERGMLGDALASEAEIEKLQAKIGQLVVKQDFWASASHLMTTSERDLKW